MEVLINPLSPDIVIGATGTLGLAQEIRTLLTTRKGSVPLDRDFGISWDMVDSPLPQARQLLISEVYDALARYIPRVKFEGIAFNNTDNNTDASSEGHLPFTVNVSIKAN